MAERSFSVDIVTPDRVVLRDEATSLVAPGVEGQFGILPNHAPLLSELAAGELRYRRDNGEETRLAVSGGFLQVFENEVTVLADTAERVEEIDLERARESREQARRDMREAQAQFDDIRLKDAEAAEARAANRIRVAGGR